MTAPLRDATSELLRAIRRRIGGEAEASFEEVTSRSWASATFSGARHEVAVRLEGERAEAAAAAFETGLEAAEFALRGHILADVVMIGREPCSEGGEPGIRLRIEALTVEEC